MSVRNERESNNTISHATDGAFLTKYKASSFYSFVGHVQMFDTRLGLAGDKYDPIDYYRVGHTTGLKTVKLEVTGHFGSILDTKQGGITSAYYEMFVSPAGGFSGKTVHLVAENSYSYNSEKFSSLAMRIKSDAASVMEAYEHAKTIDSASEAKGYKEAELLGDAQIAVSLNAIMKRAQELNGKDYTQSQANKDIAALKELANANPHPSAFHVDLVDEALALRRLLKDFGNLHYSIDTGGKAKEVSWASLPSFVWNVAAKKDGIIGFAGTLLHQSADFLTYEFHAATTDVFTLKALSETKVSAHAPAHDIDLHGPHAALNAHESMTQIDHFML